MKKKERRQEEVGEVWVGRMCDFLKGGVLAGFSAVLLLLLCAVLISYGVIGERWTRGAVLAVCVLGSFVGGIYSIRKIHSKALLVGPGVGAILFLLLITAGLLAYDTASVEQGGAEILCACLCGGSIAGIFGRKSKRRRKR